MIKNTTGPTKSNFLERGQFSPVRVSAGLRRKRGEAAQELAAEIDALYASLAAWAAAEVPAEADWGPRLWHGHMIRVTPELLRRMKEMILMQDLNTMIWRRLNENPEWHDLLELLR